MHEILEKIKIGINVVIFLLRTDRGIQASEVCGECLILLNNLNCGIDDLDVNEVIFNAYYAISGYTNAARYTSRLIGMFHNAGILMIELGKKYREKSRFAEAKKLFERAVAIMKTIGYKRKEAVANGYLGKLCFCVSVNIRRLKNITRKHLPSQQKLATKTRKEHLTGTLELCFNHSVNIRRLKNITRKHLPSQQKLATKVTERRSILREPWSVFQSLGEYQKAKEYHEKALAIATEIGDRIGDKNKGGASYGNLGVVFQSLGEYQKAKEYHEKALAIATEIGDKNKEETSYGNLGSVFHSLGEYQKAKEYHEKALAIATEIGDTRKEKEYITGTLEVCFNHSVNIRRLKNIARKQLPSQQKLATDILRSVSNSVKERIFYGNLGTLCFNHSVNIRRLKNITRKHLPS